MGNPLSTRPRPAAAPRALASLTALSLIALAPPARAGWPMLGHDPSRTARGTNPSRLARPVISWRYYLGGSVTPRQMLARDVNADGSVDVVLISGGKLVAKYPDDSLVWETAPLNLKAIHGVLDLNRDGTLDVVVSGQPGLVAIFSGRDGHLEWRTNPSDYGSAIGAVRFADLDGNGTTEMYVSDANCGSVNQRSDAMYVYDFTAGFGGGVDNGAQRVQLETGRDYYCGNADVLADVDGDGQQEIVAFSSTHAYLYSARTGQKIPSGGADPNGGYDLGFSVPYGVMRSEVVDVDGDGRQDIVGYTNNSYDPSINSRALFVISWDPSRSADTRLYVRWIHAVPDLTTDEHPSMIGGIVDLDGDGRLEIVDTFVEGGIARLYVFDAQSGGVLAEVDRKRSIAVFDAGGGTRPTLLVQSAGMFEGYRFSAPPTAAAFATPAFTNEAGGLYYYEDRDRGANDNSGSTPLTIALRGNNHRGLPVLTAGAVKLWDFAGATPALLGTYAIPTGLNVVASAPETDVQAPGPGILLARSDGYLLVLNDQLTAINYSDDPEFPQPGVRTGGYYSGPQGSGAVPLAAHFAPGAEPVLALDGRGLLLNLDASAATLTRPPAVRWQWTGARNAALVDQDGDGNDDLIAAEVGDDLVVRGSDGATESLRVTVGAGTVGFAGGVVPLRGPGGLRYAVPLLDSGNGQGSAAAVDATGVLWRSAPHVVAGSGQGEMTVDELDGDGQDDVMFDQAGPMRLFSGADGHEILAALYTHPYMTIKLPAPAGGVTHVSGGAYAGVAGVTIDHPVTAVQTVWSSENTWHASTVLGAVAQCPAGLTAFGDGALATPNARVYDAATGAVLLDKVLAGGQLFDDVASASAAGKLPGVVGNFTATQHLEGDRVAFLVGSTDGYLYAIDPCAQPPALIWSLYLRAPVGQAILGDTDGDGQDEIVVEAADGFVYGVDTEVLPAPAYVWDIDPTNGMTSADVDETLDSQLTASWADVPGATGYEWAVFTSGGTPVSRNPGDPSNPFAAVPAGTHSASFGTSLRAGGRYFFAVRALGNGGASAETVSDGTRLSPPASNPDAGRTDAGSADAGANDAAAMSDAGANDAGGMSDAAAGGDGGAGGGGGCHCSAPGAMPRGGAGAVLLALAVLPLARRRRRRR